MVFVVYLGYLEDVLSGEDTGWGRGGGLGYLGVQVVLNDSKYRGSIIV